MKRQWILGTVGIAILAVAIVIVDGRGARAHVSAALASEAIRAPAGTLVVTSTADSGPGTLRQALLDAVSGETIIFDTGVFPPGNPQTIMLTSALPVITQGNLTIDASNAGVILDGSGIGTTPETVLLDDVSLTLDGGPNLITNGDFSGGLGHWRPWDDHPGATRGLNSGDFHSSPYSYGWSTVAHVADSRTVYDTTDTSAPFYGDFDDSITVWIPATGGSTVEVSFWYRYGHVRVILYALFPDADENIGDWGFDWDAGWTHTVVSETLPGDAVGVALAFDHGHSERWATGLSVTSNNNAIRGLQIVNFPSSGIDLVDGAQNNTIGGDRGVGAGPMGQGNLLSGNGGNGVDIGGSGTTSNTVSGNYIGVDASGTVAVPNKWGVSIWGGAQYNIIGGTTPGERNLISGNRAPGYATGVAIVDVGTDHNTVIGNYVGTDPSGTAAVGNGGGPHAGSGVTIQGGSSHNTVGGDTPEERNLISGNNGVGVQILFDASHNIVSGNYIGTDVSGTAALTNTGGGVQVGHGSNHNTIGGNNASPGGTCSGGCNLISGNDSVGLAIEDNGADYNVVSGNYIGTDVSGTVAVSNGGNGVYIFESAAHNTIGGDTSAERNLISANESDGVSIGDGNSNHNIVTGNYIGTDVNGTAALGNDADGVRVWGGVKSSTIADNVISGNVHWGVDITDSGTMSNTVSGNLIGIDATGTAAMGNGFGGVTIQGGAERNVIGGDTPEERNVISGNDGDGISISGSDQNTASGNYIGTDINGTAAIPNVGFGVDISWGASNNIIGGDTPGERNVISGHNYEGVSIFQAGTNNNAVSGNYIGTDAYGTASISNSMGIRIWDGAQHNTVGGDTLGERNVISGNDGPGVSVDGTDTLSNTVTRNAIYDNGDQGISLSNGGNAELPAPVIAAADPIAMTVQGTACAFCTVEVFSDDEDEGQVYEGTTTADASGNWTLSKGSPLAGPYVTATATDTGGNTSEFSSAVAAEVYRVYLPQVSKNAEPPSVPPAPVLYGISNPDGDGNYTVNWSVVSGATSYTLEEDDNADFSTPTAVYSGPDTSTSITGKDAGTYYYRVKASNASGSSDWSDVRSVVVTVTPSYDWTHLSTGITETLEAVYFVDSQHGWVAGIDGAIFHTADGGHSWQRQDSGTTDDLSDMFFMDLNRGWVVGGKGLILRTTNGGDTWATQTSPADTYLEAINFADENHGYIAGCHFTVSGWPYRFTAHGYVLRSTDGGDSWSLASRTGISSRCVVDLHFVDAHHGWLATYYTGPFPYPNYPRVYMTSDGGDSWTNQSVPISEGELRAVDFVKPETGWIVGSSGLVLHTANGGDLWSEQDSGVTSRLDAVDFVSSTTGWVVEPILRTTDGGGTWASSSVDPACTGLRDVHLVDIDHGWAVGSNGVVCKYH